MAERVAHWIAESWEELRLAAPYAVAALVSGGSLSPVLLALVWLFQHHHKTEPRT
jgi:hypothetical protein